jgi:hypothetical protein
VQISANIRARRSDVSPTEQGRLIGWGYALTVAAMRKWIDPDNPAVIARAVADSELKG